MANKGVGVFNYIRQNSSSTFKDIVPTATSENILTLANILFDQSYEPQLNEFINNLINRIGLTIVRNKSYENPLRILKKGSMPLGTDIQDIYTNPAQAKDYEFSENAMAEILKITDPDTKVAYYRRNRRDKYTVTVTREGLQAAFVSWEKFEQYITSITNSLYSGNYIDEYKYTKLLIDGAYDNNKIIQAVVSNPVDESTGKAFVKKVKSLYKHMKFPSTEYNAYSKFKPTDTPVTTWTEDDRFVLVLNADVAANIDVDVLAAAFNIDKVKFMGRVIEVDGFENDEILGVLCDESLFQIYENQFRFTNFYNPSTLSWNFYLHVWQTYALCPFANAVLLTTAQSKPATAISLGNDVTVAEEATASVTATLTPADATTEVDYVIGDKDVATIVKNSETSVTITGVAAGSTTLTATTDNGLTDEIDVTVTANA